MEKIEPEHEKDGIGDKIDRGIEDVKTKLDGLRVKAHLAGADARSAYEKTITELEHKKRRLEIQLADLKKSGGKAADKLKDGVVTAYEDLKNAAEQAGKHFR